MSPHDEDPGWEGMRLLEPPSRVGIKEALAEKRQAVEDAKKSQPKRTKQTVEKKRAAPNPKNKDWGYLFFFDTRFKYSSSDLRYHLKFEIVQLCWEYKIK